MVRKLNQKIIFIFIFIITLIETITGCILENHPNQFVGRWQCTEQGNTTSLCSIVFNSNGTCDGSNCTADWKNATWKVDDNKLVVTYESNDVTVYTYSFSDGERTLTLDGLVVLKKIG